MDEIVFVVKVSKFCNLRCAYCYEHRELHIRDNMSFETLANLFAGVDEFGDQLRGLGLSPEFSFVWHGGEPLLLPPEYYERITELQKAHIGKYAYRNSIQSNLYGHNKKTLAYILGQQWQLGVSIDFAPDVRSNAGGRDSNAKVIATAESLHASGAKFGIISVLGSHNSGTLPDAYDWVAKFANGWRILPVFDGGPQANVSRLRLAETEVVQVFAEVFRRRAGAKRHIPIDPLDDYLKAATLRIVDDRGTIDVARETLDNIFVVNVNGDIFTRPFAYDAVYCVGNINRSTMPALLSGEPYKKCLAIIARRKAENCVACDYRGYCDSSPMHEHGSVRAVAGRELCLVPRGTIAAVERELSEAGVDRAVIGEWAREWLAGPQAARNAM